MTGTWPPEAAKVNRAGTPPLWCVPRGLIAAQHPQGPFRMGCPCPVLPLTRTRTPMIFDATTAESGLFERRFDACVIGSGPAGITLARRLAAQGRSVALMEAGGLELTPESQEIQQGEITGLDYPLDVARLLRD